MTHCDHPFPDRFKKKCPIIIISCSHFISIHIETNLSNINSGTSVIISVLYLILIQTETTSDQSEGVITFGRD